MRNLFAYSFILFFAASCQTSKDQFASYIKFASKEAIKQVLDAPDAALEKDSINIEALIKAENAKKFLGRKVSKALTQNGVTQIETDSVFFKLSWSAEQDSLRRVYLHFYKK